MFIQVKSSCREIGKSVSILSGPIAITADPIQSLSCISRKKKKEDINQLSIDNNSTLHICLLPINLWAYHKEKSKQKWKREWHNLSHS